MKIDKVCVDNSQIKSQNKRGLKNNSTSLVSRSRRESNLSSSGNLKVVNSRNEVLVERASLKKHEHKNSFDSRLSDESFEKHASLTKKDTQRRSTRLKSNSYRFFTNDEMSPPNFDTIKENLSLNSITLKDRPGDTNLERVITMSRIPDIKNIRVYLFKRISHAFFIIEISFKDNLINVNVSLIEDTFSHSLIKEFNFTRMQEEILLNKNISTFIEPIKELHTITAKLSTDSFNYDYHLKHLSAFVSLPHVKYPDFNLNDLIICFLRYYQKPPKYAKNYLSASFVSIDLGCLNGVTSKEFMDYFCKNVDKYGFGNLENRNTDYAITRMLNTMHSLHNKNDDSIGSLVNNEQKHSVSMIFTTNESNKKKRKGKKTNDNNKSSTMKDKKINSLYNMTELNERKTTQKKRQFKDNLNSSASSRNPSPTDGSYESLKDPIGDFETLLRNDSSSNFERINSISMKLERQGTKQKEELVSSFVLAILSTKHLINEPYLKRRNYRNIEDLHFIKRIDIPSFLDEDDEDKINRDQMVHTKINLMYFLMYTTIEENKFFDKLANEDRYKDDRINKDCELAEFNILSSFNEAKKNFERDQLWIKILEPYKTMPFTYLNLKTLISLSYKKDIALIDEKIHEMLELRCFGRALFDFIKTRFYKRTQSFSRFKNIQGVNVQESNETDLVIFSNSKDSRFIHLEFHPQAKSMAMYFVKKSDELKEFLPHNEMCFIQEVIDAVYYWLWLSNI